MRDLEEQNVGNQGPYTARYHIKLKLETSNKKSLAIFYDRSRKKRDKSERQISQQQKKIEKKDQQKPKPASINTYFVRDVNSLSKQQMLKKIEQKQHFLAKNIQNINSALNQRKNLKIPQQLINKDKLIRLKFYKLQKLQNKVEMEKSLALQIQDEINRINKGYIVETQNKNLLLTQFKQVLDRGVSQIQGRKNRFLQNQKNDLRKKKNKNRDDFECKIIQIQNKLIYSQFDDQKKSLFSRYKTRINQYMIQKLEQQRQAAIQKLEQQRQAAIQRLKNQRQQKIKSFNDEEAQETRKFQLDQKKISKQYQTNLKLQDIYKKKLDLQQKLKKDNEQHQQKFHIYDIQSKRIDKQYHILQRRLQQLQQKYSLQFQDALKKREQMKKNQTQRLDIKLKHINSNYEIEKTKLNQQISQKQLQIQQQDIILNKYRQLIKITRLNFLDNQKKIQQLRKNLQDINLGIAQNDKWQLKKKLQNTLSQKQQVESNNRQLNLKIKNLQDKRIQTQKYIYEIQQYLGQLQMNAFKLQGQYSNNIKRQKTQSKAKIQLQISNNQKKYTEMGKQIYQLKKLLRQCDGLKQQIATQKKKFQQKRQLRKQEYFQKMNRLNIKKISFQKDIEIKIQYCKNKYTQKIEIVKKQLLQCKSQSQRFIMNNQALELKNQQQISQILKKFKFEIQQFKNQEANLQRSFKQIQQKIQQQYKQEIQATKQQHLKRQHYLNESYKDNDLQKIKQFNQTELKKLKQTIQATQDYLNNNKIKQQGNLNIIYSQLNKINTKIYKNMSSINQFKIIRIKLKKQISSILQQINMIQQIEQGKKGQLIRSIKWLKK